MCGECIWPYCGSDCCWGGGGGVLAGATDVGVVELVE